MRSHTSTRRGLRLILTLGAGGLIELLSTHGSVNRHVLLAAITLLLLSYLVSEVLSVRREQPQTWLLNPAVMTSAVTFAISFGVTNVLFFLPADMLEPVDLTPYVSHSMIKLMWLVLLAAIAMWVGYRSPIGKNIGRRLSQGTHHRWIRSAPKPHAFAIPCLAAVALMARLLQLHFGIFGYASNYANLIEMGRFTQYLSMAASLGPLSLLLAALTHYWHPKSRYCSILLVVILVIEIGFGILSGFKSQVAMPFVIVGVCYYLTHGRIPIVWIGGFVLAIFLAYAVIQPYRNVRNSQYAGSGDSVSAVASSIVSAQDEPVAGSYTKGPTWLNFLARSSLLSVGSLGIAYQDAGKGLPAGSPAFLKNLIMAPVYAVVPRFLAPGKPVGNMGLWYTRVVLGKDIMSATAPSPFTYLYFAGGTLAIVAFFWLLGTGLKLMTLLLRPSDSIAASLVYLVLLGTVATVPSAVDGMAVNIIRTVPLILLVQLLLFPKRASRRPHMIVAQHPQKAG
ncbi:MAG TPA: hypothetical protein VFL63_01785 [Rhodanobacteraceae bacterium]|nr:hypothetical protein [Rhodanobacteraceae bacterium]